MTSKTIDISNMSTDEQIKELYYGFTLNNYVLTQHFNQEGYLLLTTHLMKIYSLIQNIIVLSYNAEEKLFNRCKENLKLEIASIIEAHEEILNIHLKEKNKNLN